jgi:protein required for attachment to host cells
MSCTWIVVAESSRAKVYQSENRKAPLLEVAALVHPEGRLHEGDLVSDQAGSDGGSVGQGRHVVDGRTRAREHEHISFAKEIASRLEAGRNTGAFDSLVLAAPPAFLGLLRENLSKQVMAMVSRQIDKNLVLQPVEALLAHL